MPKVSLITFTEMESVTESQRNYFICNLGIKKCVGRKSFGGITKPLPTFFKDVDFGISAYKITEETLN